MKQWTIIHGNFPCVSDSFTIRKHSKEPENLKGENSVFVQDSSVRSESQIRPEVAAHVGHHSQLKRNFLSAPKLHTTLSHSVFHFVPWPSFVKKTAWQQSFRYSPDWGVDGPLWMHKYSLKVHFSLRFNIHLWHFSNYALVGAVMAIAFRSIHLLVLNV